MTNTTTTTSNNSGTPPIARIRRGRLSAAIWQQTTDKGNFYNFTVERSYKTAEGKYQSSNSFALSDALLLAKLANLADTKIRQLLDADYAASQTADSDEEELA